MNKYHRLHIHTDCQAVHDLLQRAIRGIPNGDCLHHDYDELWQVIVQHIQSREQNMITVTKVRAHRDLATIHDQVEQWYAQCNASVDQQAKLAVTKDNFEIFAKFEKLANLQKRFREQTCDLHAFLGTMSERDMELKRLSKRNKQILTNHLDINDQRLDVASKGYRIHQQISDNMCFAFPWGPIFFWRIVQYAKILEWPEIADTKPTDISCLELFTDYVLWSQTYAPINRTTQQQRGKRILNWVLEDTYSGCDTGDTLTLLQQNTVWTKAICWLVTNLPTLFPRCSIVYPSRSLAVLGNSAWRKGLSIRPRLAKGNMAAEHLWIYFTQHSEGAVRDLYRPLNLPHRQWRGHPTTLDTLPEDISRRQLTAQTIFREEQQFFQP